MLSTIRDTSLRLTVSFESFRLICLLFAADAKSFHWKNRLSIWAVLSTFIIEAMLFENKIKSSIPKVQFNDCHYDIHTFQTNVRKFVCLNHWKNKETPLDKLRNFFFLPPILLHLPVHIFERFFESPLQIPIIWPLFSLTPLFSVTKILPFNN